MTANNFEAPASSTIALEEPQKQLEKVERELKEAFAKINTQEDRLREAIVIIKNYKSHSEQLEQAQKQANDTIKEQKIQIELLKEKLRQSRQLEPLLKEAKDKISVQENQLGQLLFTANQRSTETEILKEKLRQSRQLEPLLKEAKDKISVQENQLGQLLFTLSQQATEAEVLKERMANFVKGDSEKKNEIKQEKSLQKLRALLNSLLYLLSSVLLGFGINLQTTTPPDSLGISLIALAISIQIILGILVIFI